MAIEKQRLWLTFEKESIRKPVLCELVRKFDLTFNIHNASVTKEVGIIAVEIEGDRPKIKDGIRWMESQGVQVEPVEINTIEG